MRMSAWNARRYRHWCVCRAGSRALAVVSRLRGYLRERLPLYMVPTTIVQSQLRARPRQDRTSLAGLDAHTLRRPRSGRRPPTSILYRANLAQRLASARWASTWTSRTGGISGGRGAGGASEAGSRSPSRHYQYSTVDRLAAAVEARLLHACGAECHMRRSENGPTLLCFAGAGGIAIGV